MLVVHLSMVFVLALLASICFTPLVIKLAYKIGAIDKPDERRVHSKVMPRIGGLAIFAAFLVAISYIYFIVDIPIAIIIGAFIIVLTGFLDDKFQIRPWQKLLGQTLAASVIIFGGLQISYITIPFIDKMVHISPWYAIPISFIWIIGVTNAINLIDGLDGLAGGVSAIAATSIFVMAVIMGNVQVALLSIALIGAILGFLYFNFHPAKIFMGDTGSLLLGFLLSVFSLFSFKQVTLVTLFIPIIILAVPIVDTAIAIIRRKLNKQRIMDADKCHMHHRLLDIGLSHKQAVIYIYAISAVFGFSAIMFYKANLLGSAVIFIVLLIMTELLIEKLSLINKQYKPLLKTFSKLRAVVATTKERVR